MAIAFGGVNRDVFGGPAGSTREMMMNLVQQYMQGQQANKQRDEEKALAQVLMGNMPYQGSPDVNAGNPPTEEDDQFFKRAQNLMSDPNISLNNKMKGLGVLNAQKELIEKPKRDRIKIEYYKDGKKQAPVYVGADQINQVTSKLDSIPGVTWDIAKDTKKYNEIWAGKPNDPNSWRKVEYEEGGLADKIKELRDQGDVFRTKPPSEDKTDDQFGKIKIGNNYFTTDALRGIYNTEHKIMSESELLSMEAAGLGSEANKQRARQANAPKFSEAVNSWRKQGFVPGAGPIDNTTSPEEINKLSQGAPVDDDAKRARMAGSSDTATSLDQNTARDLLIKVGWNGIGKPTEEQKKKARELAKGMK